MKEFTTPPGDKKALRLLKKVDRFNEISEKDLPLFVKLGKFREYEPKETIISEGAEESLAFFLLSGAVKILKSGREIGVLQEPGEVFGEMDSIGGTPRTASVISTSKTLVLAIDTSIFNKPLRKEQINFSFIVQRIFAETLAIRLCRQVQENDRLATELNKKSRSKSAAKKVSSYPADQDFSDKTILVVDHVESRRKRLEAIIKKELNCFKVFEVTNGHRALALLDQEKVDLIIAELNMTKMSGFELLEKVKKTVGVENTPFIIVCSETSVDKIKQAAEEDITHFKSTQCIVTPFNANTVIDKVKTTFQKADKKKKAQPQLDTTLFCTTTKIKLSPK